VIGGGGSPTASPTRILLRPDAAQPVLLTSLASAAIMNGSGEFSLLQDARGAPLEWGGVYAQGVRLISTWRVRITLPGGPCELGPTLQRLAVYPWAAESTHALPGVGVVQTVAPFDEPPGVLRRLTLTSLSDDPCPVHVETEMVPYLAPVLIEGIKPYEYRVSTAASAVHVSSHGAALALAHDPLPTALELNAAAWLGGTFSGEVSQITAHYSLVLPRRGSAQIAWVIWGGLKRTVEAAPHAGGLALAERAERIERGANTWVDWRARTPLLRFPDAPWLEDAYRSARDALRALYTAPVPELTAVLGGYPWYASVWCRDLGWMLPALIWLGDTEWTERSVRSIFRYQARSRLPILGAASGELPMQISPGPIFLYGTSDTTLYYPAIVTQFLAHGGRSELLAELYPALERIGTWGAGKVHAATGLLSNGNELDSMRAAARQVGKVHYGFDAFDTTIWDSVDRRDHAIDVQVLWVRALRSLAQSATALGKSAAAERWTAAAQATATKVVTMYRWAEEEYLYDSIHHDGTPVRHVRPNALRVVSAGLLEPALARSVVLRAARSDLTTEWGLRTLSANDATYRPTAYHDGQVWSIATAWAADAALAIGEVELGLRFLKCLADRFVSENGYGHECYRGDLPRPYDSCFLLGLSIAPFLTTLFERLWGLAVDAPNGRVTVAPRFPRGWNSASLHHLRIGSGHLDLDWRPDQLTARWSGAAPLDLVTSSGTVRLHPESPSTVNLTR
jgi:Amylo-alpha-1,6-glucosidase